MKTPLRYQVTEFDCGTTSFLNALSYIFNREEIPAEVIHTIMMYTLDNFSKKGIESEGGTSRFSLEFLEHWVNQYAMYKKFPIKVKLLKDEEAILQLDKASKLFASKGCILASVWHGKGAHYVIITKLDNEHAYIFDPYYVHSNHYDKDENIEIIHDRPVEFNRKVKISQLYLDNKSDYALIKESGYQELLLIEKT